MAEVAAIGLALAVFPIIISSVNLYIEGGGNTKSLFKWRKSLSALVRELKVQHVLFNTSCRSVLNSVFPEDVVEELISGRGWTDEVAKTLCEHLGQELGDAFIDTLRSLGDELRILQERLFLHTGSQV